MMNGDGGRQLASTDKSFSGGRRPAERVRGGRFRKEKRRRVDTGYSIPLVLGFATVVFALSTHLLVVLPRRLEKSSRLKYEVHCEKLHSFTTGYLSDMFGLGAIMFQRVIEEKLTSRGHPDEFLYPTSVEMAMDMVDMTNPATWLHDELLRKVRRVSKDESGEGFSTRLLLAPLVRNKTDWERPWAKIGPHIYPNRTCCQVRDFKVMSPPSLVEWLGASSEKDGIYAPWTYGWTHNGDFGDSNADPFFGGNFLPNFDEFPDQRRELVEHGCSTFTTRPEEHAGLNIAVFYPIMHDEEIIALGMFFFTNLQRLLESLVDDNERLELHFDSFPVVGKGPQFKKKKMWEKVVVYGVLDMVSPSPRTTEIVLECSTGDRGLTRNVMLARAACGTAMVLSVFFFVVFSYQYLRQMRKVRKINMLEKKALSEKMIKRENHFVNHELKNRLIIMQGIVDDYGIDVTSTRQHVNELVKESLALIRKREIIEALHSGVYDLDANYISVAEFLPHFAETFKLIHDGRPLVYSVAVQPDSSIFKIDETLLRISLDSMTNCVARYGDPNGAISCSLDAEDDTVVKLRVESARGPRYRQFLERCGDPRDAEAGTTRRSVDDCGDDDAEDWTAKQFSHVDDDIILLQDIESSVSVGGVAAAKNLTFSVTATALRIDISFNATRAHSPLISKPPSERSSSLSSCGREFLLPLGKIYVLDDSAFILRMLKVRVEEAFPHHSVVGFGSPAGFVEAVMAEEKMKVVLCLLDEHLGPGVECGTSVVRRLLKRGYNGLLVSVSANTSAADLDLYKKAGMHGNCDKGASSSTLKSRILDIVEANHITNIATAKPAYASSGYFPPRTSLSDKDDSDEKQEEAPSSASSSVTLPAKKIAPVFTKNSKSDYTEQPSISLQGADIP